ncbi:SPOSA6832_03734, partial [Sporobolomyces salmonicolor]
MLRPRRNYPDSPPSHLHLSSMADTNPPVDDIFAGMKKKKKSTKKAALDELDVDAPAPSAPSNDAAGSSAAVDLDAAPTPADAADPDLDFSDLKKKKKKKTVRIDSDAEDDESAKPKTSKRVDKLGNEVDDEPAADAGMAADVTAVDASGMDEFADLKKKRKKSSKKAFDLEAFERELAENESANASSAEEGAAPKSILKQKAAAVGSDDEEAEADDEPVEGEDPFAKEDNEDEDEGTVSKAAAAAQAKAWLKEDRDYTYTEVRLPHSLPSSPSARLTPSFPTWQLLGRFFSLLYQSHPSLSGGAGKKKYTIPPPQLFREGNKRSIFANIADICKRMHRQPEHVIQFLFAELGTNGSVDGSARLVIKGRFQQKQIENVLRRYIQEYVSCRTCKSPDTTLSKVDRLFFMTCSSCGSTRSVQAIKTGFQATTRAARRAAKAAA